MKTIDLNFIPTNRLGEPHGIDYPVGRYLVEQIDKRINKERPALEASIANQLAETNSFEISTDPGTNSELSDFEYIRRLVEQLEVDNLLKGQILKLFC